VASFRRSAKEVVEAAEVVGRALNELGKKVGVSFAKANNVLRPEGEYDAEELKELMKESAVTEAVETVEACECEDSSSVVDLSDHKFCTTCNKPLDIV